MKSKSHRTTSRPAYANSTTRVDQGCPLFSYEHIHDRLLIMARFAEDDAGRGS
jgi:hypothetical protein